MEFTSLRQEIIWVVKNELKQLSDAGMIEGPRETEILDFLESRFGQVYPLDLVEGRLNEMIQKFEELYIPLVSINIKKYIQNAS